MLTNRQRASARGTQNAVRAYTRSQQVGALSAADAERAIFCAIVTLFDELGLPDVADAVRDARPTARGSG